MTMCIWIDDGEAQADSGVPDEIFSRLENCLQELWAVRAVQRQPDGDYPFAWGADSCWVRVMGDGSHSLAVFGNVLIGVDPSHELLLELSEMNARTRSAYTYWHEKAVVACAQLEWSDIDTDHLRKAINSVAYLCTELGPSLAIMHGGHAMSEHIAYRPVPRGREAND